jgi:hypothetical protein
MAAEMPRGGAEPSIARECVTQIESLTVAFKRRRSLEEMRANMNGIKISDEG